ncbi:hypothetical protein DZJ_49750 [Dickeya ananatis]
MNPDELNEVSDWVNDAATHLQLEGMTGIKRGMVPEIAWSVSDSMTKSLYNTSTTDLSDDQHEIP